MMKDPVKIGIFQENSYREWSFCGANILEIITLLEDM
jgi:hypothetical protein